MISFDYEEDHSEIIAINEKLVIASVQQQELAENAQKSEQRLHHLVQGLNALICEVDWRTGMPVFISLGAETFLGHPLDRWYKQPDFLTEIIHPSDRERVKSLMPNFGQENAHYEYDFRALSADTETRWMRNIARFVYDHNGAPALLRCVIVDVTTQRQTAQELEAAYTRERHIAETLQRALLFMPPENSFPGIAVKTLYESASDNALVGGDFWDTFACDHGNVALVVGDVMGHGLPAAVFTAELKYALRGFVREHVHPGRIMAQLNAYLCESFRLFAEGLNAEGDDSPICLTLAIVNTVTGQGAISGAGMESPLLVRQDGSLEEIKTRGLLLGVQLDLEYQENKFQFNRGDMIIMTTDGVTEARHGKKFLGYEGLMRLVHENRELGTLEEIGNGILKGSKDFSGGKLLDDACVLLAARL